MKRFEDELPIPEDLLTIGDCYRVHCLLSDQSAGQSKVFLAERQSQKFAIKVHEKEKYFKEEVGFLQKFNSRHIVKMIDFLPDAEVLRKTGETQKWPVIILQFVERGDMCQYWRIAKRFSEATCKTLFKQMLKSIEHMHQCGITHRDIKLQNFIFDKHFVLKVADFGFSTYSQGPEGDGILREGKGTSIYWAPEIHKKAHKGLDRDLFSAVIILFLIYTGYPPFTNTLPQNDKYKFLKDGNQADCEKYWEIVSKKMKNIPAQFKSLIQRSFLENPDQRLGLQQLLNHSWVNTNASTQEEVAKELGQIYEKLKVKDERIREVEKLRKECHLQIYRFNHQYRSPVRSEFGTTRTLGTFVKKYCEYEQMDFEVSQFPKKLTYYSDPSFEQSPCFVIAWVYSLFSERLRYFMEQLLVDSPFNVKLEKWSLEIQKETKNITIILCYEVDDEIELVKIQGRLYRLMDRPQKWGISWRNIEDNEFWANHIISTLQHELQELAQTAFLK